MRSRSTVSFWIFFAKLPTKDATVQQIAAADESLWYKRLEISNASSPHKLCRWPTRKHPLAEPLNSPQNVSVKNRKILQCIRGWFRVQDSGPSAARDGRSRAYSDVLAACP